MVMLSVISSAISYVALCTGHHCKHLISLNPFKPHWSPMRKAFSLHLQMRKMNNKWLSNLHRVTEQVVLATSAGSFKAAPVCREALRKLPSEQTIPILMTLPSLLPLANVLIWSPCPEQNVFNVKCSR